MPARKSTSISQYKLWQKRVNDAGGITLKKFGKKVPIELVEYDDRGQPDELIKLLDRLVQQDKVDLILSPYATHMNLAAAPILDKHGYPTIITTAGANRIYELAPRSTNIFWSLAQPVRQRTHRGDAGRPQEKARSRAASQRFSQRGGQRGEQQDLCRGAKKEGLEVVFSKSYPMGARICSL